MKITRTSSRIGHCRIKVKVIAEVQTVFSFTAIQNVRSYNSNLVQARKLILKGPIPSILVVHFTS